MLLTRAGMVQSKARGKASVASQPLGLEKVITLCPSICQTRNDSEHAQAQMACIYLIMVPCCAMHGVLVLV